MEYWLEYWWLLPIALAICVLVCLVGVEGSLLFAPFYAVIFPWLSGVPLTPLQAIQIGIISEIFGFTSSFTGFLRAGLIDFRVGARTAALGIPAALIGVVLAYRLPQPVLLVLVATAMPALAWYIRHPPRPDNDTKKAESSRPTKDADEDVRAAATHIPLCCYSSANYYTGRASTNTGPAATTSVETGAREHRDRRGRSYRYGYQGGKDQMVIGSLGGMFTGLLGFGIGVLGVAHLVIRRIPVRIAVGTSHFVILLVTGAAVAAHAVEITTSGQAPPWNIVAANVTAVLVGGQLAAWLAGRLPEHKIRTVLVVLLLALAVVTVYRATTLLLH
jgi:uncharacterized membrane protein YfcA